MTTSSKKGVSTNTDWILKPRVEEKTKKWYSADEMIDAYFKGRKDQKDESEKILYEKFEKNLQQAKEITADFFALIMAEHKIKCKFAKLRANRITDFDAIIVVSQSDFISDEFKKIYSLARKKKEEVNTNTFQISFTFMPETKNIDENKLLSDGFILRYGGK